MKTKKKSNRVLIPVSKVQEESSVEIRRFIGDTTQLVEIVFRTKNSSVSHSLSLRQFEQLREEINRFVNE